MQTSCDVCALPRQQVCSASSQSLALDLSNEQTRSVTPLPGKNAGLEVMVQGKQMKTVADMLMAKGITKKWIESADQTGGKK